MQIKTWCENEAAAQAAITLGKSWWAKHFPSPTSGENCHIFEIACPSRGAELTRDLGKIPGVTVGPANPYDRGPLQNTALGGGLTEKQKRNW